MSPLIRVLRVTVLVEIHRCVRRCADFRWFHAPGVVLLSRGLLPLDLLQIVVGEGGLAFDRMIGLGLLTKIAGR